MDGALTGGFADPARDAARAFRAALDAMSRPGRVVKLDAAEAPGLGPAAATLLLVLADQTTPVWIPEDQRTEALLRWIAFHTGAPVTGDKAQAAFAVGEFRRDFFPFEEFPQGTPDYPDRSTTVILECPTLTGGWIMPISGPGVPPLPDVPLDHPDFRWHREASPGVSKKLYPVLRDNHARYPLGLDFFFTCRDGALALPRSTQVEVEDILRCT